MVSTDTLTVYATVIGSTVTQIGADLTVVELETVTVGASRFARVSLVEINLPTYITVISHVPVRLPIADPPPNEPALSNAVLIGLTCGSATVICLIAGAAIAVVRTAGQARDDIVEPASPVSPVDQAHEEA
jgi:hypothetical protein